MQFARYAASRCRRTDFEFEIEEEQFRAYRVNREGAGLEREGVMHADPERNPQ